METVLHAKHTRKILWPNDLSECSEAVLPYVKSLAQQYDAEVHVLYVAEDLMHHESWYGEFAPERVKKIMQWEQKRAGERHGDLPQAPGRLRHLFPAHRRGRAGQGNSEFHRSREYRSGRHVP